MSVDTITIPVDPATRFVRSLPGEYFLLREAAQHLGVSQFTLRKFIADDVPECTPSKFAMFGKVKIYLYTREDIESIKKHIESRAVVFEHDGQARRVGRPPTYTKAERHYRSRLYSKAWYWKNREKLLSERGDEAGAAKARERAEDIARELRRK
jgi:hypothetical protein